MRVPLLFTAHYAPVESEHLTKNAGNRILATFKTAEALLL